MSRILHTVEEILQRYKALDPPANFEDFGPVKNPLQLKPVLLQPQKQQKPRRKQPQSETPVHSNIQFNPQKISENQDDQKTQTNVQPRPFAPQSLPSASGSNPPSFQPQNLPKTDFVPDFSEPDRVETFESILKSDPNLPPGINAKPIPKQEVPQFAPQSIETSKLATFDKIFEKEMLNRPDQAGHYFNPQSVNQPEQKTPEKEENSNKSFQPTFAPKAYVSSTPIYDPTAAAELQQEEQVTPKKPSFDELEQEELKTQQNISKEDEFSVPDKRFEEEPPEFKPSSNKTQYRPPTLEEVEEKRKKERKEQMKQFTPYIPQNQQKASQKPVETKPASNVPSFNDLEKYVEKTEGKQNKPNQKAYVTGSVFEEEKKEVIVEAFQPKTVKPMKFAPSLDEIEEIQKKEAAERRKQQQQKGLKAFSEIEKSMLNTGNSKSTQPVKQSNAPAFDAIFNEAQKEEE